MKSEERLFQLTRFSDLSILTRAIMTVKDAASRNRLLVYNNPSVKWLSTDSFNKLYHERHYTDVMLTGDLPLFDSL